MRVLRHVSLALTVLLTAVAFAEEFDGSVPLECKATKGHDCLPEKNQCTRLKPENDVAPVFGVDFANKTVRSPYRTALLPIATTQTTDHALIMRRRNLLKSKASIGAGCPAGPARRRCLARLSSPLRACELRARVEQHAGNAQSARDD